LLLNDSKESPYAKTANSDNAHTSSNESLNKHKRLKGKKVLKSIKKFKEDQMHDNIGQE
jgi:hypothetical protein